MKDRIEKIFREPLYIFILEISLVSILGISLRFFNIQLFTINSPDLTSILGTILQSSVTIIAILFSLLLFVGESYLGKYVTSSLKYVINNTPSLSLLCLYVIQILSNIIAIISNNVVFIDLSIILFISCILLLLPYYLFMNKLFNPRRLIDEALKAHEFSNKDDVEIIRLVYQITLNLVKNNEIVDAIYGIEKIVSIGTRLEEENKFNAVCIEYLERIAVDGFSYDPVVTEAVIGGYGKLLDHIETKNDFMVGNYSNYLTSSCNKINTLTGNHLYSERSLMMSFQLYNRVYVSKSLAEYGFSAPMDFRYIYTVIELMKSLNMEDYKIFGGFVIGDAVRKMVKEDKDDDTYNYLDLYVELLPIIPFVLHALCTSILLEFPIEKKELGLKLIRKIKEKHGELKIRLIRNDNKTGSSIGGPPGELKVETGNDATIEKVGWFESVFTP